MLMTASSPAAPAAEFDEYRAAPGYGALFFHGEARQILATNPHVRLTEDIDTHRWNYQRMAREPRKPVLNAEPSLDLGTRAESAPALRSCIVVPLVESDALVAVLGIYSKNIAAFTEDHLRLLEVLGSRLAAALVDAAIADEHNQAFPVVRPRSLKLVQSS